MTNEVLAKQIYKLQNKIVRELNDAHIFLEQARPLLIEAKTKFKKSKSGDDRRYYVPSISEGRYAKRTDAELKEIFERFANRGLFEAFLVTAVSQFEDFLGDILIAFFKAYPMRVTEKVATIPACGSVSAKDLLSEKSKDHLIEELLSEHVTNVFRQKPAAYLGYVVTMLGIQSDPSYEDFYEVAATRDLIVHNNNEVNQIYIDKSGRKARGEIGAVLLVDESYYEQSLVILKSVAGAIKREVEVKYGATPKAGKKQAANIAE